MGDQLKISLSMLFINALSIKIAQRLMVEWLMI
jgi:hypothetical protein